MNYLVCLTKTLSNADCLIYFSQKITCQSHIKPLFERSLEICMKNNICAINPGHEIEFVVGPKLQVTGVTPYLIPIDKIVGFDLIQPCKEFKAITFYPQPIALESNGLYTLIPEETYWKPDLIGISATHINCLLLPTELDETTLQTILSVINHIHCNRTLLERNKVYDQVDQNNFLKERIKAVYGIDNDIFKQLSSLLIKNGYAKPPQKRKSSAKKGHKDALSPVNSDIKKQQNSPENNYIDLENKWNEYAKQNGEVLTFDEIVNVFPVESQQRVIGRLYQLISEEKSLIDVWTQVSKGLSEHTRVKAES